VIVLLHRVSIVESSFLNLSATSPAPPVKQYFRGWKQYFHKIML